MGTFKWMRWFVLIVVFPIVLMALIIVIVSMMSRERTVHINSGETYVMSLADSILSGDLTIMSTSQNVSLYYYHNEPVLKSSKPVTLTGKYWLNPGEHVMYSHYLEQGSVITLDFASIQGVNFFLFKSNEPYSQFENRSQADYLIMKLSMNDIKEHLTFHISSKDTYYMVFENVYDDFYSHLDFQLSLKLMEYTNNNNNNNDDNNDKDNNNNNNDNNNSNNNNEKEEEVILSVDCIDCLANKIAKNIKKVFILPYSYSSNGYLAIENKNEQKLINMTTNRKNNLIWSPSQHIFKHSSPLITITIQGNVENDREFWHFLFLTVLSIYLLLLYFHNIYYTNYHINLPVPSTVNARTDPSFVGMDKCLQMTFQLEESARRRLIRKSSENSTDIIIENEVQNNNVNDMSDTNVNQNNGMKRIDKRISPMNKNNKDFKNSNDNANDNNEENNNKIKINLRGQLTYGSISDIESHSNSTNLPTDVENEKNEKNKKNENNNTEIRKTTSRFFNYFLKYRKLESDDQENDTIRDNKNEKKNSQNKNDLENMRESRYMSEVQNLWGTFSANTGIFASQENPMLTKPGKYRRISGFKEDLSRRGRIVSTSEKAIGDDKKEEVVMTRRGNMNRNSMIDVESSVALGRVSTLNERKEIKENGIKNSEMSERKSSREEVEKKIDNCNGDSSGDVGVYDKHNDIKFDNDDNDKNDESNDSSSSSRNSSIGSGSFQSCNGLNDDGEISDKKVTNIDKNSNNSDDSSNNNNNNNISKKKNINDKDNLKINFDNNISIMKNTKNDVKIKCSEESLNKNILISSENSEVDFTNNNHSYENNLKPKNILNNNVNEKKLKFENLLKNKDKIENINQNDKKIENEIKKKEEIIGEEIKKKEILKIKIPSAELFDFIPEAKNKLRVITPIMNNRKSIDDKNIKDNNNDKHDKNDINSIRNSPVTTV